MTPPTVFSVSQLTARIKDSLETTFPQVWVAGELSDVSRPHSGHIYLTLKDHYAQLRGVIWRTTAARLLVVDLGRPGALEAIAARRVVRLDYISEDGQTHTTRDVEAMGLLRGGDSWMFVGWCRLREGIRGFQLHRIRQLEITGDVFPERDTAVLDADLSRWRTRRLG